MLPDRVSNPGPLTYESGALPIALRGPAEILSFSCSVLILVKAGGDPLAVSNCKKSKRINTKIIVTQS